MVFPQTYVLLLNCTVPQSEASIYSWREGLESDIQQDVYSFSISKLVSFIWLVDVDGRKNMFVKFSHEGHTLCILSIYLFNLFIYFESPGHDF